MCLHLQILVTVCHTADSQDSAYVMTPNHNVHINTAGPHPTQWTDHMDGRAKCQHLGVYWSI